MHKRPHDCRFKFPSMLAVFAAGLIVSYLLPTSWVIFLLACGLLTLGICRYRH